MFRRLNTEIPEDPSYVADPQKIGLRVTEDGHFIDVDRENSKTAKDPFTTLYYSDNDRLNEVRREAIHACARARVAEELAGLGMKTFRVVGDYLTATKHEDPEEGSPHVEILASHAVELKQKVVLVVGEQSQDLGIWAWRWLMREGGMGGGSAVGLVKEMQDVYGGTVRGGVKGVVSYSTLPTRVRGGEIRMLTHGKTENGQVAFQGNLKQLEATSENSAPGLIIFNPGQLNYSPALNTSMTTTTWLARTKPNTLSDPIAISETYNRIPGHRSPGEHVATMFDSILPMLLGDDVQLYIVGISDGSEHVLKALDNIMKHGDESSEALFHSITAMCLIQPTHNPHQIESQALKDMLAKKAIAYVVDHRPKNTLLGGGHAAVQPPLLSDYKGRGKLKASSKNDPSIPEDHLGDAHDELNVLTNGQLTLDSAASSTDTTTNADDDDYASANESIQSSTNSVAAGDPSFIEPTSSTEPAQTPATPTTDNNNTNTPKLSVPCPQNLALEDIEILPEFADAYAHVEYSCPTYSSGEKEIGEMVWPGVFKGVVGWFRGMGEVGGQGGDESGGDEGGKGGGGESDGGDKGDSEVKKGDADDGKGKGDKGGAGDMDGKEDTDADVGEKGKKGTVFGGDEHVFHTQGRVLGLSPMLNRALESGRESVMAV